MNKIKRDWTIDFLKGIAIIMVFLVHSMQPIQGMNYIISTASHLGQLGCQLFFLLSGYLAVISFKKTENGLVFLRKKGQNILPAWRIMMCLYFLYTIIGVWKFGEKCYRPTEISPLGLLSGWFGLHGIFPQYCNRIIPGGWYIGTLMLFYILTPIFMKLLVKLTKVRLYIYGILCMLVAVLITVMLGNVDVFGNNTYGYYSVLIESSSYLIGMGVAEKKTVWKGSILEFLMWSGITVILYFSHLPLSFVAVPFTVTIAFENLWELIKNLKKIQLKELRITKTISYLGSKSYYIYLTHILVVWYLAELVQLILRNLKITINGTVLYVLLLFPEIILTATLSLILEKIETVVKHRGQRLQGDKTYESN